MEQITIVLQECVLATLGEEIMSLSGVGMGTQALYQNETILYVEIGTVVNRFFNPDGIAFEVPVDQIYYKLSPKELQVFVEEGMITITNQGEET